MVAHSLGLRVIYMRLPEARRESMLLADGRDVAGEGNVDHRWAERVPWMATLFASYVMHGIWESCQGRDIQGDGDFWRRMNFAGDRRMINEMMPTWREFLAAFRLASATVVEHLEEIVRWAELLEELREIWEPWRDDVP